MASSGTKQYGLILPTKKGVKKGLQTVSIFGAAITSDAESQPLDKAAERRRVGAEAARSFQQAQVQQTHDKALAEDASVFDYDGVYDQMQTTRADKKSQRKAMRDVEKQQPKYIATLMEKAKVREIEHERIRERRLLKEREVEDAEFGDKEKLISASYKRKLQDMQRWDEEDVRLDAVEAAEDVTKRGANAMAGFYSNLLTKNLAMGGTATSGRGSAYTVGGDKADAARSRSGEAGSVEAGGAAAASAGGRAEKPIIRASDDRRIESARAEPDRDLKEVEVVTQVETTKKKAVAATVDKEQVVSAARARFLARKAARLEQPPPSHA